MRLFVGWERFVHFFALIAVYFSISYITRRFHDLQKFDIFCTSNHATEKLRLSNEAASFSPSVTGGDLDF
jgi:hypothetical protein